MTSRKLAIALAMTAAIGGMNVHAQDDADARLDEIVVTGIRGSLQKAIDLKRDANTVMDAITAEDIGDFPDQNIAEALSRMSGVSISRSRGEGNRVTVRGFGPQFNNVSLNNRLLATVEEGREFDFQVMPSELISGAQVFKSASAQMTEGSIGASINLVTARPLNLADTVIAGSVTGFSTDLADEFDPRISGIFSKSSEDDRLGFLFGFAFEDRNSRTDTSRANGGWQPQNVDLPDPANPGATISTATRIDKFHQFRLDEDNRERLAFTGTFQFRPTDEWDLAVDLFRTTLDVTNERTGNVYPFHIGGFENVVLDDLNTVLSADKIGAPVDVIRDDDSRDTETSMAAVNASWERDSIRWEFDVAYSEASSKADREFSNLGTPVGAVNYSFDFLNQQTPDFVLPAAFDANDLSQYRAHFMNFQADEIDDEVLDMKADFTWSAGDSSIKAGIAYLDRTKDFRAINTPGNIRCTFCGRNQAVTDPNIAMAFPVSDFLSDAGGNFPRNFLVINTQALLAEYATINPSLATDFLPVLDPVDSSLVEESTISAYLQADFAGAIGTMPFSGNIGVRLIDTDQTSSGFAQEIASVVKTVPGDPTDPNLTITFTPQQPVQVDNSYNDVLPSVNLKLELTDEWLVRYAASKVITRPTLSEIATGRNFSANGQNFTTNGGNPNLVPFEANQTDLFLEWYPHDDLAMGLGIFYKDIQTFIAEETRPLIVPGPIGPVVFDNTSPQNVAGGEITGIELSYTQAYTFLPSPFDGLGVQFNFTYADSKDSRADLLPPPVNSIAPSSALEGFAKTSYNLIAFYEKEGFSARLAYNWRDDFLNLRRGRAGLPENVNSYGQLDFSLGYQFNDAFSVHLEGINVTDETNRRYADTRARVLDVEYSGARYLLSVRAKL